MGFAGVAASGSALVRVGGGVGGGVSFRVAGGAGLGHGWGL